MFCFNRIKSTLLLILFSHILPSLHNKDLFIIRSFMRMKQTHLKLMRWAYSYQNINNHAAFVSFPHATAMC